jgi:alkylation response protein AidB-like acyl-CoA dehydrogenase
MDTDLREGLDELFTGELASGLRRLGERPIGAGAGGAALEPAEASARAQVWRVLCELGVPRLAVDTQWTTAVEVCRAMGFALYRSPFQETAMAAAMIAASGADPLGLLPRIAEGRCTAAVAARESGMAGPNELPPVRIGPGGRTVSATRRFVAFAGEVDYLLLVGRGSDGPCLGLVKRDQPGVTARRQDDIARGDLYAVSFVEAAMPEGAWLGGSPMWTKASAVYASALEGARLLHAAYLAGLTRGALALTVQYVKQRAAFGQPIGRFQSPAFRLAALHARLDAVDELVRWGAREADGGDDAALTALRAIALAGDLARDAGVEAVQLHGAYGMTEECDAQRFYRCAASDAIWLGTPTATRAELAGRLAASC